MDPWTIRQLLGMHKEVPDKQKDLEKSNLEIVEKIEKLSRNFDSIQLKLDKIIETLKPEMSSKIRENKDPAVITIDSTQNLKENEEIVPTSGKYFVLKHTYNNVSSFENDKFYTSEEEEHFGVIWQINVKRCDGFFSYSLFYLLLNNTEKNCEIEVELEPKLVSLSSSGKKEKRRKKSSVVFQSDPMKSSWRCLKSIEWDEFENDFLVDDCFCAEIAVKVKKMTGVYKENMRSFDETKEESSDVVLIVDGKKFYVSKLYLAHSPYFKNLFMGKFSESRKSEIQLSGIDADDFQKYLEVLYGEQAIDEFNVEGILIVANKYDSCLVIEKCENFLQKESNKTLKTKLQLSKRYNLDALRKRINNTLSEWTIEKVLDKQKDLEKSDLEIVEKIEKLSKEQQEKFDLILSKLDEIVEKWKSEASSEIVVDDDAASLTASVDSIQNLEENEEMISTSGKYFVLKHTFNNVSSFENGTDYFSEKEEHFGVRWQISVERCDGFLSLYLYTSLLKKTEKKWEIEVENEKKIVSRGKKEKSGNKTSDVFKSDDDSCGWGESEFIEWDEVEKHFLVDDSICVEIAVKVRKMTGIYKENVRSFDKTMEECSDVVLIVNDEKFYVSKLYLATHSSYFKTLFLGKFNEANLTEIELSGIDSDDFQKYLEVLYAESAINDYAVEGILMVADMYDTRLVIHKCENFLKKTSKKNLKKKLQLSIRYNLASLRKQCLEEIKTVADIKSLIPGDIRSLDSSILKQCLGEIKSVADIKSVIPGDIHDLDPSIMAEFLQRALYLYNSE